MVKLFSSTYKCSIGNLYLHSAHVCSLSVSRTTANNNDNGKKNDGAAPAAAAAPGDEKSCNGHVIKVVLKVDYHCDECETKLKRRVRRIEGVLWLERNDDDRNLLTVIGQVDPEKLRCEVEKKMKKKTKVELISPEIPVTTAVMKVDLASDERLGELCMTVWKIKGFSSVFVEKDENQVTVEGAIDMKALAESLTKKLKTPVVIVPPKKDEDKDKDKAKDKDGNEGGAPFGPYPYGYGPYPYGYGPYGYYLHPNSNGQYSWNREYVNGYGGVHQAEQMLSDENANACSIL